ncbi:MAG: hypothetical protein QM770_06495 [Tepidisphaeraceae bacterium]
MALDAKLVRRLQKELETATPATRTATDRAAGPRLTDDARRLWRRASRFVERKVVDADVDADALELACWAMQLPMAQPLLLPVGRMGVVPLRERAEQAAELLVGQFADDIDDSLLDRATRLLHETPQRPPMLDEAKLLADAISLDDFGLTGLLRTLARLTLAGQGLDQLLEAVSKREQYGYFEARLKDGFHFDLTRQIARQRLDHLRQILPALRSELEE